MLKLETPVRQIYKALRWFPRVILNLALKNLIVSNKGTLFSNERRQRLTKIISDSGWLNQNRFAYISLFENETKFQNSKVTFQQEKILSDGSNISIIIVSYKRLRVLIRLLESIPKSFRGEILVLSQGNSDSYNKILEQWKKYGREIRIVTSEYNLGAGAGRNLLVRESKNNWIMSLDSDMIFFDYVGERLSNQVNKSGAKFFSLPFQINKNAESNNGSSTFFVHEESKEIVKWLSGPDFDPQILKKHSTISFAMPGGASLFYRPYFNCLGGFNEDIGTYEDLELSFRIQNQGMYVEVVQDTFLFHAHDSTGDELLDYEAENSNIIKYSSADEFFIEKYGISIISNELIDWLEARKR